MLQILPRLTVDSSLLAIYGATTTTTRKAVASQVNKAQVARLLSFAHPQACLQTSSAALHAAEVGDLVADSWLRRVKELAERITGVLLSNATSSALGG